MKTLPALLLLFLLVTACQTQKFDIVIRGGTVYDGSGSPGVARDVGINADTIAFIGDLSGATGKTEINAAGLAVAPGFINMLSWATETLIIDGKSQADIRQGVTLEVFGEGESMGPLNEDMKANMRAVMKRNPEWKFDIDWTTLNEYLESLQRRGVAPNVASFVGATTLRIHELGYANRLPNEEELNRMKALVKQAMEDGALGVGSSLIYAPANYSSTEELIALCKVAGEYGGMYITHMRSEGNNIYGAVNETIRIAREASLPAEIYHLKMAGRENWNKLDSVMALIDRANKSGAKITADMYTYIAGATGLDATMPPWVQEGGIKVWIKRLQDPKIRKQALDEMRKPSDKWENLLLMAGGPDRVLLLDFANDSLKRFIGKTLAEVSEIYGKSPEETAMDLVITDSTRVGTAYFMMSEENVKRQIALPYVSFCSDAGSPSAEGVFLKSSEHPRAYGNFARLLGKYVRDEKVIPLEEAIRKLTSLPASNLKIKKRGSLIPGYYADIAIFDAEKIQDHATFENPHQYSTGMVHVLVNGTPVLKDGEHTGAKPGRVVRGPGWKK
ncbi:MAG: aminoacylase [Bacteroidota bacterium]|nr:MAG: N-acyl-D-amino-acid deacylase [Bacteroidetes bacterium OLB12]GIL23454.1 MAG: aminoacylase [Bacteroidota bacterium]HNR75350.1 D-aminoacylase [Cyclobacteriaceae bacterium]HNU43303.1 D-aminoacylase [Cyclobacteriaceae bacterium]